MSPVRDRRPRPLRHPKSAPDGRVRSAGRLPSLLVIALALGACGQEEGPRPVGERRDVALVPDDVRFGASSAERFRLRPMGGATAAAPGGSSAGPQLHWETPEGWTEQPTTSLRQANFLVAGDPRAECYLTVLGGDGGGLLANVNRWRTQMGLGPIDEAALDALPRAEFFGAPAHRVAFDGTWSGMSGDEQGADYRLVGLLQVGGGGARFLKMVGPRELVAAAEPAFDALARSFHDAGSHDHGSHDHGAQDGGAQGGGASAEPAAPLSQSAPSGLSWTEPDGWERQPDRMMREVTLTVSGPEGTAECYVSLLGGDGGGALPNVNRWQQQMGQPELSPAEFADLPSVSMLGGEAVLVGTRGTYTGMGDANVEDAALLGTVRLLGDRAVFVKMVGPAAVVDRERDAFVAFCESLRLGGSGS